MSEPYWVAMASAPVDYQGAYDPAVAYAQGAVVTYNGVTYVAVNPSQGQTPPPAFPQVLPYALIRDEKPDNTDGGTFTSGAWQTRVLNTKVVDANNIVSLASNQFTLPPGTYRINASAPGLAVGVHQTRLQNITDGVTVLSGLRTYSPSAAATTTLSVLFGEFVITGTKTFELQHRCQATQAGTGFGIAGLLLGVPSVYAQVELWKVA